MSLVSTAMTIVSMVSIMCLVSMVSVPIIFYRPAAVCKVEGVLVSNGPIDAPG